MEGRAPVEPAHIDVVEDRQRLHQRRGLRDQRDLGRALREEELDQRRLAGPAPAHDGDALAAPDGEVDVDQHRPAVIADRRLPQLEQGAHRTGSGRLVEQAGRLGDLLDRRVVGVLGRDEFRAREIGEHRRIVDGEDGGSELVLEAGPERAVDVAADGPVVVRDRSASPRSP